MEPFIPVPCRNREIRRVKVVHLLVVANPDISGLSADNRQKRRIPGARVIFEAPCEGRVRADFVCNRTSGFPQSQKRRLAELASHDQAA
jgi:hypothetical protein